MKNKAIYIKVSGINCYVARLDGYCPLMFFKRTFLNKEEDLKNKFSTFILKNNEVYEKKENGKVTYFYIYNNKVVECTKKACIRKFKGEVK